MEVLSIDIGGKFAHFRKYYGNNTALSHTIPPRTTIMGILAAIMGRERDSYYEDFASDKIRIGVQILTPLKKTFHRLNLLKIGSSEDDFRGTKGRIQTPTEIVSGFDLNKDWVVYRIFISPTENDEYVFEALKETIKSRKQKYNLTLGTANFTASIIDSRLFVDVDETGGGDWFSVSSAVVSETVKELNFTTDPEDAFNFLEEDLLPADFVENNNREVGKMVRALFSTQNLPFEVKLTVPHYTLSTNEELQHIVFLE